MVSAAFAQVAAAVARQSATLLRVPVSVVSDSGALVAHANPPGLQVLPPGGEAPTLRVPLTLSSGEGEVLVSGPHDPAAAPSHLVRAIVELTIDQMTSAALPERQDLKNAFIHDLLHGQLDDEAGIRRQGQIFGMDLGRPRAVILIDAAAYLYGGPLDLDRGGADARARLVIGAIVRYFQLPNEAICAHVGDGEVAVLKASGSQDLTPWAAEHEAGASAPSWANLTALKRAAEGLRVQLAREMGMEVDIGIGRYHPGPRGLASSYRDARLALSLGRQFNGPGRVHCLDDLGIAAFVGVADEETKASLAAHLLSPLDHEPDLIATVEAFFAEHCYPSGTAARLTIHRNTLSYRLDKIASLTGLDPRHFDDAVQIRLALVLRALHSAPAVQLGECTIRHQEKHADAGHLHDARLPLRGAS